MEQSDKDPGPEQPIGWPSAIAPPFTFNFDSGIGTSRSIASQVLRVSLQLLFLRLLPLLSRQQAPSALSRGLPVSAICPNRVPSSLDLLATRCPQALRWRDLLDWSGGNPNRDHSWRDIVHDHRACSHHSVSANDDPGKYGAVRANSGPVSDRWTRILPLVIKASHLLVIHRDNMGSDENVVADAHAARNVRSRLYLGEIAHISIAFHHDAAADNRTAANLAPLPDGSQVTYHRFVANPRAPVQDASAAYNAGRADLERRHCEASGRVPAGAGECGGPAHDGVIADQGSIPDAGSRIDYDVVQHAYVVPDIGSLHHDNILTEFHILSHNGARMNTSSHPRLLSGRLLPAGTSHGRAMALSLRSLA